MTDPIDLKTLLSNAEHASFPSGRDYNKAYLMVEDYLNENVHPDVVICASITDGGLLNDHGVDHVKMVIERAGQLLLTKSATPLSAYEVFMLLCAIHVHDVGNITGRADHERRNGGIVKELRTYLNHNQLEIETFRRIAELHGGKFEGSIDKLSNINEFAEVNSTTIRFRALAAILKFADELADDHTRGNRRILESGKMPKGSEVYHKYSLALNTVRILPDESYVKLKYFLKVEDINRTWGKQTKDGIIDVYLLDEIYDRTKKMHRERVYCGRFTRGLVEIASISVEIEVYKDDADHGMKLKESISYRLEETGYPKECSIFSISNLDQSNYLSGQHLAKKYGVGE